MAANPIVKQLHAEKPRLLTLAEFVQRPSFSSHVRGVIPAQAFVVVFGPPKGGKTFSVCDLTMHAAHGLDWHGCAIPRRLKVAYLIGEGQRMFKTRLKAWLEDHDSIEEIGEFRVFPSVVSLPDAAASLVETHLRAFAPDIVVADTLNAYFGSGDENNTPDMSAFCRAVRYIRDELACSVIIIHHTGHGDQGRERGSIVLRASADVVIQVAKDESAGELVGFQVIAARDLEPMDAAIALRLVKHETEWLDDDGEPLNSCIVRAADQPVTLPGRGGKPLGPVQAQVLQAIQEMARGKPVEPNGETIIARHEVAQVLTGQGTSRKSVSSAWSPLAARKLIRLVEPGSVAVRLRT